MLIVIPQGTITVKLLKKTEFSICCPYIYLAHYDKLSTKEGRQELENADLRPELCRLSVGLEDPDEMKSAIAEGLNAT